MIWRSLALFLSLIMAVCHGFYVPSACRNIRFHFDNDCAILYQGYGCEGWAVPITAGYSRIGRSIDDKAGSVAVRQGCILTAYEDTGVDANERGHSETIDARVSPKYVLHNFNNRKDIPIHVSSVKCKCFGTRPMLSDVKSLREVSRDDQGVVVVGADEKAENDGPRQDDSHSDSPFPVQKMVEVNPFKG